MCQRPGEMAAQPSALWGLVSQPLCLLIGYVIRIYTVFTVLYCEISFSMLMNFILIMCKGVCVCVCSCLSACMSVCVQILKARSVRSLELEF